MESHTIHHRYLSTKIICLTEMQHKPLCHVPSPRNCSRGIRIFSPRQGPGRSRDFCPCKPWSVFIWGSETQLGSSSSLDSVCAGSCSLSWQSVPGGSAWLSLGCGFPRKAEAALEFWVWGAKTGRSLLSTEPFSQLHNSCVPSQLCHLDAGHCNYFGHP